MLKKQFTIIIHILILFILFKSELKADTSIDIYTPRETLVGDSYSMDEMSVEWRAHYDSTYAENYPNAIQIKLWGDYYSSSRTYNCHGYAWHMIGDNSINDPVWIGYSSPGQTHKYWQDDSYSEVDMQYATTVDYSGDHSATTSSQTDIYISKWNKYPLMKHHKNYHPGYGNPVKYLRKNPLVPKDYSTIQAGINAAVPGQTVYVSSGTYTGDIYMKSNVDIYGAGENSTTINGKVYFNNDNNVILSDVEINDKITVNNSDGVTINSFKAGHSNCYIDVTGGSFLFMSNINSAVSQTQGVYVHSGSDISIWYGSVNNKMDGIHLQDNSYGQISNVDFCTNSCYDIIAYNSSADAYGCTFSSSQPGGSVLGDVGWDFWNSCGGGGGGFEMQASSSLVSDLENNSVTRTHYPASQDYKNIIKGYNSFIDKLKQDIQLTRKFNPQNYASALNSLTEGFKKFVMNHPENRYATAGLYRIAALLRIQNKYDALSSYMHKILADPSLKHLRPYALHTLIPIKIKKQEYKEALKLYNQLIVQYPDHQLVIEWKYGKGMLLKYYMDDHAAAEEVFSEIVSNYPNHPTAHSSKDELQDSSDRDLAKKNKEESQELQYLGYNYPNPFNPTTNIRFTLPETKKVKIDIYSITGQKIKTLVNNTMKAGYHKITWDATDENGIKVSSGVYIYQLKCGNEVFTKKMIFAK